MEKYIAQLQVTLKTDKESEFQQKLESLCKTYAGEEYVLHIKKTNELDEDLEEKFIWLVRNFLGSEIITYEVYGDFEVTLHLKNVNRKIGKIDWEDALEKHLSEENIKVSFNYGDGHWVTVRQVH